MMKHAYLYLSIVALGITGAFYAETVQTASELYLKNPAEADPALKSVGMLALGPSGLLVIAEPAANRSLRSPWMMPRPLSGPL